MKIQKEIILGIVAYMMILGFVFLPTCARADEMPCHSEKNGQVCCTRNGFSVLIQQTIKLDSEKKACTLQLEAEKANLSETKVALDKCLAIVPPPCPEPKKPSAWRTVSPVVAGILGGALLTASVASDSSPSTRATGAVVGLGLLSAGIVFSLP